MAANTFHWKSHYEHQLSHPLATVDWIPGSFIFSYHSVFMYPLDLSSRDSSLGIVIKFNSFMGWLELFKFPERNFVCRKNRGWSHRQASFDVQTLRTQCPWRELQLPFFVYLTKTFYFNWKFIIVIWIFFTGSKCRKKAKKLHSRYLANPMAEYMHFSHHKDGELDNAYKEYKTMHSKKYTSPVEHEQRKHIFKHNLRWYFSGQAYEISFIIKIKIRTNCP